MGGPDLLPVSRDGGIEFEALCYFQEELPPILDVHPKSSGLSIHFLTDRSHFKNK